MPMSRRQSLERPGLISPQGPFLTPSPSSSISASPRHQPSPSQSPFSQDVLLLTSNTITNTTQEQERKAATPSRRPSLHQLSASPNAGTIIFQPSPSQSPAAGATIVGVTGNEFNTTLVGSNNILLNKKGVNKRTPQTYSCYGQATSVSNNMAHSAQNMASSPKGTSKKAIPISSTVINASSSPLTNESPISSPNSGAVLKSPTPQPMLQQFPVVNAGNQFLQFIQGPQLIAAANNQTRPQLITSATVQNPTTQTTTNNSGNKMTRGPQQILPKPQTPINQLSEKNVVTQQSKNITIHQTGQISQSPQTQQNVATSSNQAAQGGQIILPTGNLNTPQLLLNQMPVIVQQNTPQGVQLILRPPTPQIATPSLVIHNTRPQLQQPQPQQLLRILNTNGPMQLTAAPTFIVSSQANLIQQNLQTIKTNTPPTAPITQLSGLHAAAPRSQQLAAAINSHILGQSVAQLQNLQLNGNLAQIHMSNSLNGPIISQLPAQFQQSLTNFNQINQNINLNQLNGTNLQQIAAAAAAAGAAFQSPTPSQVSEIQMPSVVSAQNIQFSTNNNQINTLHQPINLTSPTVTPQPQLIQPVTSVTPDPVRNTSVLQNVVTPQQTTTVLVQPDNIVTPVTPTTINVAPKVNNSIKDSTDVIQKTKKPKNRKKKAQSVSASVAKTTSSKNTSQISTATTTTVTSEKQTQVVTGTGKLDLANVIKLCGIMEDDDYMDSEVETHPAQIQDDFSKSLNDNQNLQTLPSNQSLQQQQQQQALQPKQMQQQQHILSPTQNQQFTIPTSTAGTSDIMITIPSQNNDFPITFTIPTSQCDNKMFSMINENALPAYVNNIASDVKGNLNLETQNIVIKIDSNESGQPYTISIPRVQNEEMLSHNAESIQPLSSQQTVSCVTPTTSQINVPKSSSTVINSTVNQSTTGSSTSNTNTLCISGFVNSSNNHIAPTIQSQINEIQNQLMGVTSNSVVGSSVVHSTGAIISQMSTAATTTTTTTTAAIKPRRKPAVKRNGKKVETISTSVGSVPSQIGNIQISQIDSTKINNQNMAVSSVVENKIQITPILDNKIAQGNQQQQQQQQVLQQQTTIPTSIQQLNHATMQQQSLRQQVQSNYNLQHIKPSTIQNNFSNNTKQHQMCQVQNTAINSMNEQNNANKKVQQSSTQGIIPGSLSLPGTTATTTTTTTSTSSFISQLTGSLSLAVAEDGGRLLLRHDPNNPQDAQSQIILQAIISGALPNITIINEGIDNKRQFSVVQQQQQQQQQSLNTNIGNNSNNTMSSNNLAVTTTTNVSLPLPPQSTQVSSTRTTQTISHNQRLTPNSTTSTPTPVPSSSSVQYSNVVNNDSNIVLAQKNPLDSKNTDITATSVHNNQHLPQQEVQQPPTIVADQNSSRLIALPKINSNQQLFSLNTITNQITHINPSQNAISLSPMETLLIVPAGINAQQLAQCMSQGQIHFNNIGQVTQAPSPSSTSTPPISRVQQQVVYPQQHQPVQPLQSVQQTKQVANVAPIIDTSKTKLDSKPKKTKQPRKQKPSQSVNEGFNKTIKPMQKLDLSTKLNMNPVQIVQPNMSKENTIMKSSSETNHTSTATTSVTTTTTTANTTTTATSTAIHSFQTQTGTKLVGITAPMQQLSQQKNNTNQCNSTNNSPGSSIMVNNNNNNSNISTSSQSSQSVVYTCSNSTTMSHQTPAVNVIPGNNLISNAFNRLHSVKYTNSMPPLISVSAISQTAPKVQTIQLTPQQQQLLQTVQMQIQQLSGKLQNKNLLATLNIPSDFDPNNPIYNKPLPHLNSIQNMSDPEIHAALQRLFIEQQKILAAGKIIPTISASPSHGIIPSSLVQNQPSTSSSSSYQSNNASIQSCQLQSNNCGSTTSTLQTVGTQPTYTCSLSSKSITVSASISCATKSSHSAKNEIQSIPANIVQPNNHNSSPGIISNNTTAAHRVHVYPMQHHSETSKQPTHVSMQTIQPLPLPSTHHNQNQTKIKTEFQTSQINQHQQTHSNFTQTAPKLPVDTQNQNQQIRHHTEEVLHTVPVDIKIEKIIKPEIQEKIISENSPSTSLDITKSTVPRHFFFERQLKVDHESCTNPDYLTPFQDKYEAIKRLTRYHCMYQKDEEIDSTEEEFERVAVNLQNKYRELTTKYQSLLLQESVLLHRTSETCLIDHLMVDDLQRELLELRNEAANLSNVVITKQNQNNLLSNLVAFNSCNNNKTLRKETNSIGVHTHQQQQLQQQDLFEMHHTQKQSNQLQHLSSSQMHYQQQSGESEKNKTCLSKQLQNTQMIDKIAVDNSLVKNEIKSEPCDIAFDKCNNTNVSSNKNHEAESENTSTNMTLNSITQSGVGEQLNTTDIKNHNNPLSNSIIKDEKDCSYSIVDQNCSSNNTANVVSSDSVTLMNSTFIHEEQNYALKHEKYVKRELENLDIESEITPSFIMKKIDTQLTSGQVATTTTTTAEAVNSDVTSSNLCTSNPNNSEFSIDYFVNSTSHHSSNFNSTLQFPDNLDVLKKKEDDQKNEPYDEWYCIQRELNLITEKKTEPVALLSNHHSNNVTDKSVDKHLSDIFESSSPKVENQLSELFSSNSNSVTNESNLKDQQLGSNNMNLTDIFNSDSIANKSVETRLEAMFGESPIEKSRDVESRLEEFFHESTSTDEAALHGGTNGVERISHFSEIDSNNKRQWNNTNGMIPSNETSASVSYARRSCMMASYMEENHVTSNHPRWTIDQQFDFIDDTNGNTADETRKRPWNGDIINNTIDHPAKKTCFDKSETDLNHDILGLHTSGDPDHITNDIIRHSMHVNPVTDMHCQYLNSNSLINIQSVNNHNQIQHHHHHHNQQVQTSNSLIDPSSGSNLFESNLNSSSVNANMSGASSSSMSSNFEEDINRHVQNAIDSILNLQNSESDSLNFSLDHSVGSFLGDTNISDSNVVQASNMHCVLTGGNGKRKRIDDLSDCLISGSNLINNRENNSMIVESSSSVISNTTTTTGGSGVTSDGITDFSCVSNMDDAVKSIITS